MTSWTRIKSNIRQSFNSYVLAVSGGIDSMFLLDFMTRTNVPFLVAHFNHGNREHDVRDAEFVTKTCKERGLPLVVGEGDGPRILAARSLEQECRNQRYAWLRQVLDDTGYERVMTAHHANDQVETVIMRLIRGIPFDNLAMKQDNGLVFRPLLLVERREIEKQCRNRRIEWLEDESNQDQRFERNWMRHTIIPQLMERRNIMCIARNAGTGAATDSSQQERRF